MSSDRQVTQNLTSKSNRNATLSLVIDVLIPFCRRAKRARSLWVAFPLIYEESYNYRDLLVVVKWEGFSLNMVVLSCLKIERVGLHQCVCVHTRRSGNRLAD